MKTCTVCLRDLPESEFHFRNRSKGTRMNQCKDCGKARARQHYHDKGGYQYAKTKKIRHGLSYDAFVAMCESQDWTCPICTNRTDKLVVDHDHTCCDSTYSCGECVRGLICDPCNRGLAAFRDSIESLQSAIAYLGRMV